MRKIAKLESPIDAIGLIHKALLAEAARVEQAAVELDTGGTLQRFKLAFNSWAAALIHHSEQEDLYVMSPLTGHLSVLQAMNKSPDSKTSSPEPNRASPTDTVTVALVALEEELHRELLESVQEVLSVLNEEIGKTSLITRTKQHLYRQVVALRIALEDHLDTEEALVLPRIQHKLDEQQQLKLAEDLLVDRDAEDPSWMIQWVSQRLSPEDRTLLLGLDKGFEKE